MKKYVIFLIFLPILFAGCLNQAKTKIKESVPSTVNINQASQESGKKEINSNTNQVLLEYNNVNQDQKNNEKKDIKVSLILKFAGQEEKYEVNLEAGQTVFDLLVMAAAQNNFSVKFQNYPEMGVFITEIHGQENGQGNKYWQYTVNDHYAEKAADKLEIKEGDVVIWEFKESSF